MDAHDAVRSSRAYGYPGRCQGHAGICSGAFTDPFVESEFEPFLEAAIEIAKERSDRAIFILALRYEMSEVMASTSSSSGPAMFTARWDVIASVPGLQPERRESLEYVAAKIAKHGGQRALRGLAYFTVLPPTDQLIRRVIQHVGAPRELNAPATISGTSGIHLIEPPSIVAAGVMRAVLIEATHNPKSR